MNGKGEISSDAVAFKTGKNKNWEDRKQKWKIKLKFEFRVGSRIFITLIYLQRHMAEVVHTQLDRTPRSKRDKMTHWRGMNPKVSRMGMVRPHPITLSRPPSLKPRRTSLRLSAEYVKEHRMTLVHPPSLKFWRTGPSPVPFSLLQPSAFPSPTLRIEYASGCEQVNNCFKFS
jgi:hypothetical protein